jgi:hypothetical protein
MNDHDSIWDRTRPKRRPSLPFTQQEQDRFEDMMWCLGNRDILLAYPGQVVAVHGRRVWGAGADHIAAWNDARSKGSNLAWEEFAYVPIPESIVYDPSPGLSVPSAEASESAA